MRRDRIRQVVTDHIGIGFRELQRKTGVATGTLQYHLREADDIVQRGGAILPANWCETCRLNDICGKRCIAKLLRDPTKRAILRGRDAGKEQVQIAKERDLDPSTISHHVSVLREEGVLDGDTPAPCVQSFLKTHHAADDG